MSLPATDLAMLFAPVPLSSFPSRRSNTAGGPVDVPRVKVDVRVLSRDKTGVMIPWTTVSCNGNQALLKPIFRNSLETLFVCNHPRLDRLYVAHTKTQLTHRMPR